MRSKFLVLSPLAALAAIAVSGCSSTAPTPPPPSPLYYSGLTMPSGGTTQQTNGSISGTPQDVTVNVAGTTYRFGGGTRDAAGSYAGIDAYQYSTGGPSNPGGAGLLVGDYARAALIADNVNNRGVVVVDGTETRYSDMPTQTAVYDGLWSLSNTQGGQAGGTFQAGVDFDRRDIGFDLYDQSGLVGGGTGYLQGTGFRSQFNTSGALDQGPVGGTFNSNNTVDGQFYGPRAAEMAGLIQGTHANGSSTGGALIGSKR